MDRWSVLSRGCLALALVGGCGGSPRSSNLEGRFIVDMERSRGNFAVDSPIVKKADAQITALLGHPVTFRFEPALVPKWEHSLEYLSAQAIDGVARELASIKATDPPMFAWVAPKLLHVEWDYSAVDRDVRYSFEPSTGKLRIVLTSDTWNVVEAQFVRNAAGRAYGSGLSNNFAGIDPAAVAPNQRVTYVEWLFRSAYKAEKDARPPKGDDESVDAPHARVLSRTLRFAEATRGADRELETKVRERLVAESSYIAKQRRARGEIVARLPPGHDFLRAEATYVAWLNNNIDTLPFDQRRRVAGEIVEAISEDGRLGAFPGFDLVVHYLRVMTEWVTAGRPAGTPAGSDRDRAELFKLVLGAYEIPPTDDVGCPSSAPFYRAVKSDPAVRQRVFGAILARPDPVVIKTVTANLLGLGTTDTALELWRATERDEAAFRAATRIITGSVRCGKANAYFDELPRMWRAHPQRHGVLTHMIHAYGTRQDEDFARLFSPLTAAELVAFLGEEADPMREIIFIWPALGSGWSRMDVLAPRFDAWVSAPDQERRNGAWHDTIRFLADNLCHSKSSADLAKLHDWIDRRLRAHPSELQALKFPSDRSAPGGCKS